MQRPIKNLDSLKTQELTTEEQKQIKGGITIDDTEVM